MKDRTYNYWMNISTLVGLAEVIIAFIPTGVIVSYLSFSMSKQNKDRYGYMIIAFFFTIFYTVTKRLNRRNTRKIDALAKKAKEEEGIL